MRSLSDEEARRWLDAAGVALQRGPLEEVGFPHKLRVAVEDGAKRWFAVARAIAAYVCDAPGEGLFVTRDYGWSNYEDRLVIDATRAWIGVTGWTHRFESGDEDAVRALTALAMNYSYDLVIVSTSHRLVVHIDEDVVVEFHAADLGKARELEDLVTHLSLTRRA
jgi:hypothetical protein